MLALAFGINIWTLRGTKGMRAKSLQNAQDDQDDIYHWKAVILEVEATGEIHTWMFDTPSRKRRRDDRSTHPSQ